MECLKTASLESFHGIALRCHRVADPREFRAWLADVTGTAHFPGPLPVSLDSTAFDRLKAVPADKWWVTPKSDGVRALLTFFVKDGRKMCCLVDRSLDFYLLGLRHVPKALFQGTVIDGEVVCGGKYGCKYVAFDGIAVSGATVGGFPFDVRLEAVARGLHTLQPCRLEVSVKPFVRGDEFAAGGNLSEDHPADGFIILQNDLPVTFGRDFGMFKVKPPGHHTVDFLVLDDGCGLGVYDPETRGHARVGSLPTKMTPGDVLEARIGQDGSIDDILGARRDKTTANDLLTYRKTILNARENLGAADVRRLWEAS